MSRNLKDEPEQLLSFLLGKIDGMFATVYRQAVFSKFEQRVFKESEFGPLTQEQFSVAFEEEYALLFGESVKMTPHYRYQWAYIPHFVNSPFYVYAYSFGELATIALYQNYVDSKDKTAFTRKYMDFLAAGSSLNPYDLYKTMGININSKTTWEAGFKYIESLIKKVEKLSR